MNFLPRKSRGIRSQSSLRQPDSLKLTSSLAVLRHLHRVASEIENQYGDKSAEKTYFISGVQGKISKPNWARDYTYFLAKIDEVRSHLLLSCVQSALTDLLKTALDIYNRFDNRRRMGVEIMVLAMLTTKNATCFELPDKYHSAVFVFEMLVSCRHRFQKPEKCYFWSRQSESLLVSTFAQTRHLTRLKLAIANDQLLRAIAVHCRLLQELELQFALDVSEEGLCALAGKSVLKKDQGNARSWCHSHYLNKDFGPPKEWFVKDCLLFTPPAQASPPTTVATTAADKDSRIPKYYDTGFGCLGLVKLRINGDFVFPPLVRRYKEFPLISKTFKGPILEHSFYVLLLSLPKLQRLTLSGLPMVIARLSHHAPKHYILPLQTLTLDRELLTLDELDSLARLCCDVSELNNVTPECSNDSGDDLGRHLSANLCHFLKRFRRLKSFQGRMPLACFNSFLRVRGDLALTKVHLTTSVLQLNDILLLRRFAPKLETLEGKFVCADEAQALGGGSSPLQNPHFQSHRVEFAEQAVSLSGISGHFSKDLLALVSKYPMTALTKVDIEGCLSVLALQLLVGGAEQLIDLHLTNSPGIGPDAKALSDEWLEALVFVNRLPCIKNLTLRMDIEQTVEAGSFTERGLQKFLNHCLEHCPRLTNLVGEFTRVPDKTLQARAKSYASKGLRRIRVRNAVPYRRFENAYETERHYAANEGYHLMLQDQARQQQQFFQHNNAQQQQPPPEQQAEVAEGQQQQQQQEQELLLLEQSRSKSNKRFSGYVFRPYPRPLSSSDEESEDLVE